ncbi:MAG: hypothetical protein CVU65_00950 [Deltaproteobacteria bacterium HGW-Deltaproteobacteria-22]|jgi:hypothetical protein|nr:MAG: hypothetical protein CVU65_00950 [Deltaproteobacteria bacterium HGW-Deltaproteobacteria-22]
MSTLLAFLLSLQMTTAPKPNPFEAGTDLTLDLGWQGGASHTVDGVRLGVGMLTQRQDSRRWAYELNFVSGDDYCQRHNDARYCDDQWAVYGFGGIQLDFPISADRKLFASVTGGFFAGVSYWENWYWDDNDVNDDDLAIMGGIMGKASLMYEFDSFRLGVGVFAGFGPSIGSESGLEIYFPVGMHFIFHYMF